MGRHGARRLVVVVGQLLAGGCVLAAVLLLFWTRAPALVGLRTAVVTSGSMEPGLRAGDLAVLAPLTAGPQPGDVVQVVDPGVPSGAYLHRVVTASGGVVVTRGDANPVADPPVTPDRLEGRLVASAPRLGLPLHWFATGRYPEVLLAGALAVGGARLLVRPRGRRSVP